MSNARVKIKLFGSFSILADGNLVLEQLQQAKKTCLFLEYLILKRDTAVSHEELLSALWSERDSRNPATALRTLLHRYRALVEESGLTELNNSVLTVRGGYRWNPDLPVEIDVYEFERLCREAAAPSLSVDTRIDRYEAALELYTGPMLRRSSGEAWIATKSVYYHDLFLECTFALIKLLEEREQYDRIISICRRAMDVELFDERLHLAYTIALTKTGKKHEALSQYYFVSKLHDDESAEQSSGNLRAICEQIELADSSLENDVDRVQAMLAESAASEGEGAFVCPYDIFPEIYRLQQRTISRYNATMFLALLNVHTADGQPLEGIPLAQTMDALLETAQKNLRRGDTICRYSALQYALLLPSVNYESGHAVLERIKAAFYEKCTQPSLMLNYRLRALCLPAEEK